MLAITVHSSRLSSVLPKKNPTAHSGGLSSDTANATASTLLIHHAGDGSYFDLPVSQRWSEQLRQFGHIVRFNK